MKSIVMLKYSSSSTLFLFAASFMTIQCAAQYKLVKPTEISGMEIPVYGPGSYAVPGTTYKLMNDVSSDRSAIFLGKDVTLDLNGYTVRYANGRYQHIPNSGFEEGDQGWDLSKAPGAKVVNTEEVHVFVGKKLLSLKAGDEIRSQYIDLPVANRSYFAMCGVTGHFYHDMNGDLKNQMKVSVFVEDAAGKNVVCTIQYGDTTMVSCPVEKRAPRLGGGVIYAHVNNLPAGKYRIRIRADTDCLVDEIDLRPAMDVGIGIVEKTYPGGHYDHLYDSKASAFFDYTANPVDSSAIGSIPVVSGRGTVTIRNGTIENAALGVLSFGVQSTAENVLTILDNVKIKTAGINTIAVDVPQASIAHCRFEVESPFIINRHGSSFYGVDLRGSKASEVAYSEFFGGQGCLVFKGFKSRVHHNTFVNRQMVTNHYSIMAMGDSSWIFNNYIEPEVGSGIEIYRHRNIDIFNNTIKIKTSPPTCEYGHEEYSTAAVRMADYLAKAGAPDGTFGNRVYNNKIVVTAIDHGPSFYVPMSWAIYYSASAGDNEVFGNDITVIDTDPSSKVETAAFYVCGGPNGFGGKFYDNRIATNVPAAWIASMYGGASNTRMFNNTIVTLPETKSDFKAVRIGHAGCDWCVAKNIEFRSNVLEGGEDFDLQITDQDHSVTVYWTLDVAVKNKKGQPVEAAVTIFDSNNKVVTSGKTDVEGNFRAELIEYSVDSNGKKIASPYTVAVGKERHVVTLNRNSRVTIVQKK